MVIEHFGKHTENCGSILIDGTLDINVEKDCVRLTLCRLIYEHEGCRIILKLATESLYSLNALYFLIFKDI